MSSPSSPSGRARLRVGLVGLGAAAQAIHLPLLARLGDTFEIAAICDLSPGLLTALGDRYQVPATARFASVDELLDGTSLDGLMVLTSGSHGAVAQAALDRGIPVLCEKPLAFTLAEADALAASPNAERLLLGYMKVFDPAVVEATRISADAASGLGPLRAIEVTVLHPTSESQLAFAHLLSQPTHFDAGGASRLQQVTDDLARDGPEHRQLVDDASQEGIAVETAKLVGGRPDRSPDKLVGDFPEPACASRIEMGRLREEMGEGELRLARRVEDRDLDGPERSEPGRGVGADPG
ncbi:MAG TPA: Gfo/Idh/MocA family oxidoreductase, partial [Candidatus Limnocylindrales bacterium]